MKIYKKEMAKGLAVLALTFLQLFSLGFAECVKRPEPRNISIAREHVSVWFESPLHKNFTYGRDNVKEMINLAGRTFGTFITNNILPMPKLVPPETLNDSLLLIPGLVAQHNEKYSNQTIKVVVSFEPPNYGAAGQNASFKKSIEVAKFIADRANSIHPGTVDTLLLVENAFLPSSKTGEVGELRNILDAIEVRVHIRHAYQNNVKSSWEMLKNDLGQNSYKLGVVVPFWICDDKRTSQVFSETLHYSDLIVPVIYFDGVELNPLEEHKMTTTIVQDFERKIKQTKREVEVVPMISCGSPRNRDFAEVSKFLQCWQMMSDWAKKSNRTVIMYEAFDQFGELANHAGWWRLKSETRLVGPTQNVTASSFIAKADEMFGMNFNNGDMRSQAGIYFDFKVSFYYHSKQYTEQEMTAMLELVSRRFSTILILSTSEVADLVANLNRKCKPNPSCQPLKILSLYYRHWDNFDEGLRKELQLLQSANEIFPGTVSTLVFVGLNWEVLVRDLEAVLGNEQKRSKRNNVHTTGEEMYPFYDPTSTTTTAPPNWTSTTTRRTNKSSFSNITSISSNNSISLGIYVELSDCLLLSNQFHFIKKWVSVVIVEISNSEPPAIQDHHIDSTLRKLFAEWEECRQSFKSSFPTVEVSLSVDCSKVKTNSSIEQVGKCWEMVNEYGNKNQVQLIFIQAFETPSAVNGMDRDPFGGWWKLKRKSEVNITADSFEETFKDLFWDSENCNATEESGPSNCANDNNFALNLFLFLLLIALTSGIGFTIFWCYNHGKFYKPLVEDCSELKVLSS